MGDSLRREVLQVYKMLHRTRLKTFKGDERALKIVRDKINEEYKKYKNVTNEAAIEELNRFAREVEQEVKSTVVQAVETKPRNYVLNITPETALLENVPYDDEAAQKSSERKKPLHKRCGPPSKKNK